MNQEPQTTSHILMVRPAHFGYNPETAASNAFQVNKEGLTPGEVAENAVREFDQFVERLRQAGVDVIVVEDTKEPVKTDAIFPNNWVTFHAGGQVITYPMEAPVRRLERRQDVLDDLAQRFLIKERIALESAEEEGRYLEGTGSMILDRQAKIIYACRSTRTDKHLVDRVGQLLNYEPVFFDAVDNGGRPIYHTNVMMALGETFVVICLEAVKSTEGQKKLRTSFEHTNKEVIAISLPQMMAFAGNMLQVRNDQGKTFLVMSEQAFQSLTRAQITQIEKHTQILHSPLGTIETYGGGSARCMMAEVFLQEKG